MGGQILDYEAKKIRDAGRAEGRISQAVQMYRKYLYYDDAQIVEAIMDEFHIPEIQAKEYVLNSAIA